MKTGGQGMGRTAKLFVVVCVLTPKKRETRTFGTETEGLLRMAEWVQSVGIRDVAMEATASYWPCRYP